MLIGFLPSSIKKIIYRLRGYKFGKSVSIGLGSIIIAKDCMIFDGVSIGHFTVVQSLITLIKQNSKIHSFVYIDTPNIEIGQDVLISEMTVIRAGHKNKKSSILICDSVHIFPHVIIDTSYPVIIGEETAIGFYSNIYTHSAYKNVLEGYKVTYGPVTIGKRVELTYNVFVAPGVNIADDVIVGYGSYVNKDLPYGVLAAGIPVQVKRNKEQFAPVPTFDQKILIVTEILTEFCKYLQFENIILSYEIHNHLFDVMMWKTEKRIILIYNEENISISNIDNIYIFMSRKNLITNGDKLFFLDYFNLIDYECSIKQTLINKHLKRFFGRYGIRFKDVNQKKD